MLANELLPRTYIIKKMQLCSRPNCRCMITGELHGPYFHLLVPKKPKGHKWIYLGKKMDKVLKKMDEIDHRLIELPHIQNGLGLLISIKSITPFVFKFGKQCYIMPFKM